VVAGGQGVGGGRQKRGIDRDHCSALHPGRGAGNARADHQMARRTPVRVSAGRRAPRGGALPSPGDALLAGLGPMRLGMHWRRGRPGYRGAAPRSGVDTAVALARGRVSSAFASECLFQVARLALIWIRAGMGAPTSPKQLRSNETLLSN
jgi:hypothetical protein